MGHPATSTPVRKPIKNEPVTLMMTVARTGRWRPRRGRTCEPAGDLAAPGTIIAGNCDQFHEKPRPAPHKVRPHVRRSSSAMIEVAGQRTPDHFPDFRPEIPAKPIARSTGRRAVQQQHRRYASTVEGVKKRQIFLVQLIEAASTRTTPRSHRGKYASACGPAGEPDVNRPTKACLSHIKRNLRRPEMFDHGRPTLTR